MNNLQGGTRATLRDACTQEGTMRSQDDTGLELDTTQSHRGPSGGVLGAQNQHELGALSLD